VFTNVEMQNKYQIKNTLGQQVYFAGEGMAYVSCVNTGWH